MADVNVWADFLVFVVIMLIAFPIQTLAGDQEIKQIRNEIKSTRIDTDLINILNTPIQKEQLESCELKDKYLEQPTIADAISAAYSLSTNKDKWQGCLISGILRKPLDQIYGQNKLNARIIIKKTGELNIFETTSTVSQTTDSLDVKEGRTSIQTETGLVDIEFYVSKGNQANGGLVV